MGNQIKASLANQIINAVEDVCGQSVNFITPSGIIFASSNESRVGDYHEIGHKASISREIIEVDDDESFNGTKKGVNIPIIHRNEVIAVIGISGEPETVRKYTELAVKITRLFILEQELESHERSEQQKCSYVIQGLISGEISNHAYFDDCLNEFNIDRSKEYRTIVVRLNKRYNAVNASMLEGHVFQLFNLSPVVLNSYIYPHEYIAIAEADKLCTMIPRLRSFAADNKLLLSVAVGSSQRISKQHKSYNSACIALKAPQCTQTGFCDFNDLNIEILLGSISIEGKELFLKKTISLLTENEIKILETYFSFDMSLQRSCKKLFLHKNTLQYRLDKISVKTGYNPRQFREAVVLYIALLLC